MYHPDRDKCRVGGEKRMKESEEAEREEKNWGDRGGDFFALQTHHYSKKLKEGFVPTLTFVAESD